MGKYKIVYFPKSGEDYSPADLLEKLCNPNEQAHFSVKLDTLCELSQGDWNFKWLEHFNELYQVTQGNFRLYFVIDNGQFVVCHVCRKVSRKARPKDLNRAKINIQNYRGG